MFRRLCWGRGQRVALPITKPDILKISLEHLCLPQGSQCVTIWRYGHLAHVACTSPFLYSPVSLGPCAAPAFLIPGSLVLCNLASPFLLLPRSWVWKKKYHSFNRWGRGEFNSSDWIFVVVVTITIFSFQLSNTHKAAIFVCIFSPRIREGQRNHCCGLPQTTAALLLIPFGYVHMTSNEMKGQISFHPPGMSQYLGVSCFITKSKWTSHCPLHWPCDSIDPEHRQNWYLLLRNGVKGPGRLCTWR